MPTRWRQKSKPWRYQILERVLTTLVVADLENWMHIECAKLLPHNDVAKPMDSIRP